METMITPRRKIVTQSGVALHLMVNQISVSTLATATRKRNLLVNEIPTGLAVNTDTQKLAAVLGSLIPLAVPFLQSGTGVDAIGFIAAMAVASTIVDVSPFSTNGALVLASAQNIDRDVFLRQLMIYGGIVTLVAPVLVWLLFVVL